MAELEIRYEGAEKADPLGRKIGVLTAGMAIAVSLLGFAAELTRARADHASKQASDQWAYYQQKSFTRFGAEMARDIIAVIGVHSETSQKFAKQYDQSSHRYRVQADQIVETARQFEREAAYFEDKGRHYAAAIASVNLGMVLTSVYFITRRKLFPALGLAWFGVGLIIAVFALLLT